MTGHARLQPLIAGNWKMNGLRGALEEARQVRDAIAASAGPDVLICPPFPLIGALSELALGTRLLVGAQDCHFAETGAHTGDVSAEMLADAGAKAIIVGHSERRADHGENDALVRKKAAAAHRAGLIAIICVGETAGERLADLTLDVVSRQLKASIPDDASGANTVIAYEPVWAIGTGLTPTIEDVAGVHGTIRQALLARFPGSGASFRVLYGGSVKPSNAKELLAVTDVDGALVGGASLKAADFLSIIAAV